MIGRRFVLFGVLALFAVPVLAQSDGTNESTITKVATTSAQFLKLGYGARAIGLSGSYVARGGDLSSLYWNPAGLARMPYGSAAVQLSTTEYIADVQYSTFALGFNLGNAGTMAASIIFLDSGEMDVRTTREPDGTGERFSVQNFALQLSYARSLTDRFSIGGSAKFIRESVWHSSASTIAFDVGTLFTTPYERLRLGASFSNFGPKMSMSGRDIKFSNDPLPNQGGGVEIVNANYETDPTSLPLLFRVGLAWDAVSTANHRFVLSTDAAEPNDNSQYVNVGAEYVFRDLISLRAGQAHLFETDGERSFTFGGGIDMRIDRSLRARVDYAYSDFGRLDATHWFTVDLMF